MSDADSCNHVTVPPCGLCQRLDAEERASRAEGIEAAWHAATFQARDERDTARAEITRLQTELATARRELKEARAELVERHGRIAGLVTALENVRRMASSGSQFSRHDILGIVDGALARRATPKEPSR